MHPPQPKDKVRSKFSLTGSKSITSIIFQTISFLGSVLSFPANCFGAFLEGKQGVIPMDSAKERVIIVDKDNNEVGIAPRAEMRAERLPHRATYILVFNSKGELFVQKRTSTKDVFAGYYDAAAGGVVLAGESYEVGALRELEEELGIKKSPVTSIFDFYYEDAHICLWGRAFTCVYDGELSLQEEEIESGEFMDVDEVLRLAEVEPFTPDCLYVLQRYQDVRQ
jgi:8-oxo-dGTP pyrophosphatase MutT (NUDIX family)